MMRVASILLLFPFLAMGQLPTLPGFGVSLYRNAAFTPTPINLTGGELPLVWYHGSLTTNSGTVKMANLASSGSSYDLTNSAAALNWPKGGGSVNGQPFCAFSNPNETHLKADNFTNNLASGFTIGMVVAITNTGTAYITSSTNGSRRASFRMSSGNLTYYDNSASLTLCSLDGITNQWISFILQLPPNGASSQSTSATLYTNGVSAGTISGTVYSYMSGLILANLPALTASPSMGFSDMEIYTNLSSQSISDLHTYHKSTFGVP